MTPSVHASLLARAKTIALPVHSCVTARLRPDHLIGNASREELVALVEVLALAADPVKLQRLEVATGPLTLKERRDMLCRAHTEFARLRKDGEVIPAALARLETEYQRDVKRRQVAARRAAAKPRRGLRAVSDGWAA